MFQKLKYILILMIFINIVLMPVYIYAAFKIDEAGDPLNPTGIGVNANVSSLVGIIINIVGWIYTIFFIVAVIMILFAAYTYLTAQEDAEKIKSAHKQLIWAAVAIAVALLSVSANLIVSSFIGPGSGGMQGGATGSPLRSPESRN